ncbi:fumarylacetoacetate hydrolase family protein [uncultured Jatrophihabitans sp.]|uniref:fumarylacetoacetate hydrolase family protein n=1 Tax=uncultured Jatrophihabitans sp. TaxID=1610747 RepID=UPI0035C96F8B
MTVIGYGSVRGRDGDHFAAFRRDADVVDLRSLDTQLFAAGTLDAFLAAGPSTWAQLADAVRDAQATHALADVHPQLPFTVADYVDFYASEHHATNAGRIFRPDGAALPPNWKHLPVGYHGRSASLRVSGEPVPRPSGVLSADEFGPSQRLDFEAELAFVVGTRGQRIAVDDADRHVFGVSLLNDWSARDIQAFETQPLGPFLGKSFATSISPWITPLAALDGVRLPTRQDPQPLPHLRDDGRHGLDLDVEIAINGHVVSRPRFADMHWTYAQMLAHLTSNGAEVRTGDVFASGTVSGPERGQRGCLLELSWNGTDPLAVGAETRAWLRDGDEVSIRASAGSIALGDVTSIVVAG